VALAGFSAIVVVLKRSAHGTWSSTDADRFHGMVVHSICAVLFCLLPVLINVIVQDVVTTIHIACALLGVQIVTHSVRVMRLATTRRLTKALLVPGLLVGLLQYGAFTDWGALRELEIYTVGIVWHILQAGILFVLLVWIPADAISDEE